MENCIEFPNAAEGYVQSYKVIDGMILEVNEPPDEELVRRAKAGLEAEEAKEKRSGKSIQSG